MMSSKPKIIKKIQPKVVEQDADKPKKILIKRKPVMNPDQATASSSPNISETPIPVIQMIPIHPNPIDLLADQQIDVKNENSAIIEQFQLLVVQIEHQIIWAKDAKEKEKHRFRLTQIKKAVGIFESHPGKIKSGAQAQLIKGIGKGIGKRIDEILTTGTLAELTEKKYVTEYTRIIKELSGITGIGEVRARQLVDNFNVKGVADLKDKFAKGDIKVAKNQLTHHMVVGMKYYDDLSKKIPRVETEAIDATILQPAAKMIDSKLILIVCGSFRRKREFSGDIDVLISHPSLLTEADVKASSRRYLIEIVDHLIKTGFLVDSLTDKGQTKYMGICKFSPNPESPGRRIDMRFVPYDCFAPALLYFTGSGHFNKIFRGIANDRGYTVNEYGIFYFQDRKKGEKIPVFSEEDIFKIVGIKYLEPHQRNLY